MESKRIRPGYQLRIGLVAVHRLPTSKRHRTTPVIMLTPGTELNAKVKGLDAGADDYIAKPFGSDRPISKLSIPPCITSSTLLTSIPEISPPAV